MKIEFASTKLAKTCNTRKKSIRKWGPDIGNRVGLRLEELASAENLEDFARLPQTGFHVLTRDRAGQLSANVGHPYRLIFEPAINPIPAKQDGSIDMAAVKAIRVVEVVDYHG